MDLNLTTWARATVMVNYPFPAYFLAGDLVNHQFNARPAYSVAIEVLPAKKGKAFLHLDLWAFSDQKYPDATQMLLDAEQLMQWALGRILFPNTPPQIRLAYQNFEEESWTEVVIEDGVLVEIEKDE